METLALNFCNTTRKNDKRYNINQASVIALRSVGKGHSAARKIFSLLNLSPPIHQRHWCSYTDKLESESLKLMKDITDSACDELLKNCKYEEEIINIATSFDGSWGSRGWSSSTGCMAAIAEKTGKIVDIAMCCNHCNLCDTWKEKREKGEVDSVQFMNWSIDHFPNCMVNHDGSAQVKLSLVF